MLIGPCASRALNCAIFSASASWAAVSLWCICSSRTIFFRAFHSFCLASLLAALAHHARRHALLACGQGSCSLALSRELCKEVNAGQLDLSNPHKLS